MPVRCLRCDMWHVVQRTLVRPRPTSHDGFFSVRYTRTFHHDVTNTELHNAVKPFPFNFPFPFSSLLRFNFQTFVFTVVGRNPGTAEHSFGGPAARIASYCTANGDILTQCSEIYSRVKLSFMFPLSWFLFLMFYTWLKHTHLSDACSIPPTHRTCHLFAYISL